MGQIVGLKAKPKRCNLNKLSQLETPAAGEHILVSSDNSMNAAGQGNFDCYIVGDGTNAFDIKMIEKVLYNPIDLSNEDTHVRTINASNKWIYSGGPSVYYYVTAGKRYRVTAGTNSTIIALCAALPAGANTAVSFATGWTSRVSLQPNKSFIFTAPSDALFLYMLHTSSHGYALPTLEEVMDVSDALVDIKNTADKAYTYGYSIRKAVISKDIVYTKNARNVVVDITSLSVYDVISQTIVNVVGGSFTMNANARCLALDSNNTLVTLTKLSALTPAHFVLLYYDTDIYDVIGGALYADFIKKTSSQSPSSSERDDTPESLGVLNALKKAYQMANIQYTPVGSTMPYNSGYFTQGTTYKGMPYSSVKEYNQFVCEDVSFETFMTAIKNPRSVLYTENTNSSESTSALGRTYHGSNCACYYGSVCSGLLTYAYGLPQNVTTFEFSTWDDMELVEDQSPYGARLADCLWIDGHVKMVAGITRGSDGLITKIVAIENVNQKTTIREYTAAEFTTLLESFTLYRYKYLYKNTKYTPSQFVPVFGETATAYVYNEDICPNYGQKANYNEGDDIVLNLFDYSTKGYTTLEVYKNDVLLLSRTISSSDEVLSSLEYGTYKARLTGSGVTSDWAYWMVVQTNVARNGDLFEFSSPNATPIYYEFCKTDGARTHEDIGGLSTHLFTDEELAAGQATPSSPVTPSSAYPYLKVHFQTEYGRVMKRISWYW